MTSTASSRPPPSPPESAAIPTPTGVFAVIDKEQTHYSNIYGGASMPFMQRLTMSGVAMHSGMVTGRPASHGCIRLPHAFAIKLYKLTRLGVRVVIAPNEPAHRRSPTHACSCASPLPPAEPIDPGSAKGIVIATATDMTAAVANATGRQDHGRTRGGAAEACRSPCSSARPTAR